MLIADTPVDSRSVVARRLALHPQVALRREPFGGLLYHYGTRRLVFLKHPDVVRVVESLGDHESVGDALAAGDIAASRQHAFAVALESLLDSEMLHDRVG